MTPSMQSQNTRLLWQSCKYSESRYLEVHWTVAKFRVIRNSTEGEQGIKYDRQLCHVSLTKVDGNCFRSFTIYRHYLYVLCTYF